ncbi:hypothetical protein [Nocardia caishijiensis]|uniref:Uncharacterized protein n=1 Tax=Nocardia caishijiensis TaxID=184756 RepID=A0ABQ6YKB3_9NOCA|nr:hypothetical protein [Nocardia caishijiensis]KAF0846224.1 hypothetical protein FNL39_105135 [Nocardia caishijiensis]
MEDSRAKLVGPAIAVGAVSLGLIVIGACGVGQQDVYVTPPPLQAGLAAAPSQVADEPTSTTVRVSIPPSPSWRIAPYMSPRKPFSLSSTETTSPSETPPTDEPTTEPHPTEATTESRPPEATTEPPETTTEDSTPTTTRPPRTTPPTRTVNPPRTRPTYQGEFEDSDIPTTNAHDNVTRTPTPTTAAPSTTQADG